jgi:hypothetical protein
MEHFEKLYRVNVNDYTEEKNGLTYLSWANAWAEVKKIYPDAQYTIKRFDNNLPYVYDENTGYMVFTDVTIEGITYEMWLPVMDGANKAMKSNTYTYQVKKWNNTTKSYDLIEKTVEPATMFDINKTIMRCLVKNLAMFGLGLYIYAGEDLPEVEPEKITAEQATVLSNLLKEKFSEEQINKTLKDGYKVTTIEELNTVQYAEILKKIKGE